MDPSEQPSTGAAQRRKLRRLRSWWRHVAVLATSLHHSSRGQKKARAEEEESELHYTAKVRKTPLPQLVHFSLHEEALLETFVPVPSLDVPVPQPVGQVIDVHTQNTQKQNNKSDGCARGGARGQARRATATEASSPAGALQPARRGARREAACQLGRAAGATGTGSAAHRGARA